MIETRELTCRYLRTTAVDRLNLTLQEGTTCALLGPNGSGKTTLMKMIAGLTKPTSGEILFCGERLKNEHKGSIAYMPTENYFYGYMTVEAAGNFYADFYADFDRERFAEYMRTMDLPAREKVSHLSSGMSAKLRLALILSRDAKIMLFDEPLNGVDILTRTDVIKAITQAKKAGRIMIISTHLVEEIEKEIDYAVYMQKGVAVKAGTKEELCHAGRSLTDLYLEIYGGLHSEEANA